MLYILSQIRRKWLRILGRLSARKHCRSRWQSAWNIANFVLDGCGLTHAAADLHGVGNVGDEAGPLYASNFCTGSMEHLQTPKLQLRKVTVCRKKTRIKLNKPIVKPILKRINAPRLPNGRNQTLQPPELPEISIACPSLSTCSTAIVATWTSGRDATSKNPIISSSTTPSFLDLASVIYFTFILDYLKSYLNLKLNLHINFVLKFFYFQLISFLDNALSAQSHSYKYLTQLFSMRFVSFNWNKF